MFAADRIDHVQNEVLPLVEQGCLVVCDRYIYSSLAYQGSAGLSLDWIETINKNALKPDFALFIDVSPETVLVRLKRKKSIMETLETQRKVRQIYQKYIDNGQLHKIDGDQPKNAVTQQILNAVTDFLDNRT